MSATHTDPTVNCAWLDMRMELRFWLNLSVLELSTFMIAFPASLTNARLLWNASVASKKLRRSQRRVSMGSPRRFGVERLSVLDIAIREVVPYERVIVW